MHCISHRYLIGELTRSSGAAPRRPPGVTGRGFAFAPGRPAAASATSAARPRGCRGRAAARSRRAARAPRRARPDRRVPSASPKRAIASAGDRRVEAERRRQRQRVHRPVRRAVAAAERLRDRVAEREHRAPSAAPAWQAPRSSSVARLEVAGPLDDPRQPLADQPRAGERVARRSRRCARRRRAPRRSARARSAPCRPSRRPAGRASAPARRRSRAGSRPRRRRASAGPGRARRRTASTRRPSRSSAPRRAAARSPPTPPWPCRSRCRRRPRRSCRRPSGTSIRCDGTSSQRSASVEDTPRQRGLATTSGRSPASAGSSSSPQRTITPTACARANSTNASAARVGVRPDARTSEISRLASSPSTRAAVSVPAASSGSTAEREMNVTP